MIPEHVVRFGQALKPMLEMVADALAPQAAATVLLPGWIDTEARLRGVVAAEQRFVTAAGEIPRSILALKDCSDVQISRVVQPIKGAAGDLVMLLGVTGTAAIGANAMRRDETLHRITRDHVVSIAHWLADFVEVTARPELILLNGHAEPDGKVSVQLDLKMSTPDTLAELETWMPAHLAYRADHVQSALKLFPVLVQAETVSVRKSVMAHAPTPTPSPSKESLPLVWIGGALLLGLIFALAIGASFLALVLFGILVFLVLLTPNIVLFRRRNEVPPGVYWGVLLGQIFAPILGWFAVAWAAQHDFSDWEKS